MFDYRQELERRIAQFRGLLEPMNHRTHVIAHNSCFMIFEEKNREQGGGEPELRAEQPAALQALGHAFEALGLLEADDQVVYELPEEGWREDESSDRFVQFSFEMDCFHLDMPRQTLSRKEAERILRERRGFFYLSDRKQFTLPGEDVEGYDPFRKVYVYGDEESAAEDMAFILFQVWKFPVDSKFFVSSQAFNGKHHWEQSVPVD